MHRSVELSSLDLRYEGYRQRDDAREARLRASIAERGIEEPLFGVDTPAARCLLDGFKRYRSAKKLSIDCVP
jgi:ParB-like chromosome segregation protein Spo0J